MNKPTAPAHKLLRHAKEESPLNSTLFLASPWQLAKAIPTLAVALIVGVVTAITLSSTGSLSGAQFAEFAVKIHQQHAEGNLILDMRTDSHQVLNTWLRARSSLPLTLPESSLVPGEERPYRLEGARLMQVSGKTAAYIAYQVPHSETRSPAVSLIVVPDSVATSSGGVKAAFSKVTFHYNSIEGYKVVTWSSHGLTYALVSNEDNSTQRSCMVCHSAMRDRDLSKIPTPVGGRGKVL